MYSHIYILLYRTTGSTYIPVYLPVPSPVHMIFKNKKSKKSRKWKEVARIYFL
jgi:hypothetical protein